MYSNLLSFKILWRHRNRFKKKTIPQSQTRNVTIFFRIWEKCIFYISSRFYLLGRKITGQWSGVPVCFWGVIRERRLARPHPILVVWVSGSTGEGVIDNNEFLGIVSLWHDKDSGGGDGRRFCIRNAWCTGKLGWALCTFSLCSGSVLERDL